MKCKITPRIGFLLSAGLIYDTAHLRLADLETFKLLTKLLELSELSYSEILDLLQRDVDISERIANLKSMKRAKCYRIGDLFTVFSIIGSFEASNARNFLKMGADVAIVAVIRKKTIRISGRVSKRVKINLADIFSKTEDLIGGSAGGHASAASANGTKPENLKKVFKEMLKLIEKEVGEKSHEL